MHDYRIVMISTDPESDYYFVVWESALNKRDAIADLNKKYNPDFEVDFESVTEIIN